MLMRLSLRIKLMVAIAVLVVIAVMGGGATIWIINYMDSALVSLTGTYTSALNAAQEVESSLAMQRGLLSYYLLDGNTEWLAQLEQQRFDFEKWLKKARELSGSGADRELLNAIESRYIRYNNARDQVTGMVQAGNHEEALRLVKEVRSPFKAYDVQIT